MFCPTPEINPSIRYLIGGFGGFVKTSQKWISAVVELNGNAHVNILATVKIKVELWAHVCFC